MTDHDHDEIARRLRETGTVPAPDRLRAEVMDQVRAEPRLRPSRRSFLTPVIPYAAAAAILAALVLALSHLDFSGGGSASGGGGSSGGGTAVGGGVAQGPEATGDKAAPTDSVGQTVFQVTAAAAQRVAFGPGVTLSRRSPHTVVLAVPYSRLNDYRRRLRAIEKRTHADSTVRVILRPKR